MAYGCLDEGRSEPRCDVNPLAIGPSDRVACPGRPVDQVRELAGLRAESVLPSFASSASYAGFGTKSSPGNKRKTQINPLFLEGQKSYPTDSALRFPMRPISKITRSEAAH